MAAHEREETAPEGERPASLVTARTAAVRAAFAVFLAALLLAAPLAWFACQEGQKAEWPDRTSPEFTLLPGMSGTREASWEDTGSRLRERRLRLLPDVKDDRLPRGTGVQVRVEPDSALLDAAQTVRGEDGWVTIGTRGGMHHQPILDPARVERIAYRVADVPPELAGTCARLYVPGVVDSEESWAGPFWCAALFVFGFGSLPLALALTRCRRERAWWLRHVGCAPPGEGRGAPPV
jgi:hypothetical protein